MDSGFGKVISNFEPLYYIVIGLINKAIRVLPIPLI